MRAGAEDEGDGAPLAAIPSGFMPFCSAFPNKRGPQRTGGHWHHWVWSFFFQLIVWSFDGFAFCAALSVVDSNVDVLEGGGGQWCDAFV